MNYAVDLTFLFTTCYKTRNIWMTTVDVTFYIIVVRIGALLRMSLAIN